MNVKMSGDIIQLEAGAHQPSFSPEELKRQLKILEKTVRYYLPEFVKAVANKEVDVVMLHQNAFAAGYHLEEYLLLGMAIKYAGLFGKKITIHGTNHETF